MKKFILFAFTSSIYIVNAQWQKTNFPSNTGVSCLSAYGTNVYAGTDSGLYVSPDEGTSWQLTTGCGSVASLAVNGNYIFTSNFNGVYLSINNGESWKTVNNNLGTDNIYAIALNGTNVYASVYLGGLNNEVAVSTDSGANWTQLTLFQCSFPIGFLLSAGNTILCLSDNGDLPVSYDNGLTWGGITVNWPGSSAAAIGNNIFIGIPIGEGGDDSWGVVKNFLWDYIPSFNYAVNTLGAGGGIIFAGTIRNGIYISTDTGSVWTDFNEGLTDTSIEITNIGVSATTVYARDRNGVIWRRALSDIVTSAQLINANEDFAIYPNPAGNELRINPARAGEGPQMGVVSIYNVLGQEASPPARLLWRGEGAVIDVSGLAPGVYFVEVVSDNGRLGVSGVERCMGKFVKE